MTPEEVVQGPGLHAEILARIVLGGKVIDHERIFGIQDTPMEIAAVYEVTDDRIARVWFFPADQALIIL